MNKKISNLLILLLILFSINIGNVKADGEPDGNGYSQCYYTFSYGYAVDPNNNTPSKTTNKSSYKAGIIFYHDTDNYYRSYGVLGWGYGGTNPTQKCEDCIKNYDDFFYHADDHVDSFYDQEKGEYTCPSKIYVFYPATYEVSVNSTDPNVMKSLYIFYSADDCKNFKNSDSHYKSVSESCEAKGLTANNSKQSGSPTDLNVEGDIAGGSGVNKDSGYSDSGTSDSDKNKSPGLNAQLVEFIQGWANLDKQNTKDNGGDVEQTGCNKIFSQDLLNLIQSIYRILCTIVIVILVSLMAADFIKVITAGNDDEMPKAIKRSRNRIIATIILFFIPVVLDMFLNYLNLNFHVDGNNTIKIGTVADCKSSE